MTDTAGHVTYSVIAELECAAERQAIARSGQGRFRTAVNIDFAATSFETDWAARQNLQMLVLLSRGIGNRVHEILYEMC